MTVLEKIKAVVNPVAARESHLRSIWPTTLTIESSFACNLTCIMCPRSSGNFNSLAGKASAILKPETFERILPSVHRFGHVHLTGWGEPLANPHLIDYIRVLREKHHKGVSFANNGTLLDEEKAEVLTDLRIESMNVSCDASTRETFERVRGKGMFDLLIENLRRFCAINKRKGSPVKVTWVYVMMRSNLGELADAVRLAGDVGVDRFVAKHLETALNEEELHEALYPTGRVDPPTPEVEREYLATIKECREAARQFPGLVFEEQSRYDAAEQFCLARPDILIVMDHLGNMSPCCYTMPMNTRPYQLEMTASQKSYVVGNVHEQSLEDIISGPKYREFIEAFRRNDVPKTCEGCIQMARRKKHNHVVDTGAGA
jgi:MoaA/NifB/PqqE/SkfB family radical SAM enzyme